MHNHMQITCNTSGHSSCATCCMPGGTKGQLSYLVWQSWNQIHFSFILLAETINPSNQKHIYVSIIYEGSLHKGPITLLYIDNDAASTQGTLYYSQTQTGKHTWRCIQIPTDEEQTEKTNTDTEIYIYINTKTFQQVISVTVDETENRGENREKAG